MFLMLILVDYETLSIACHVGIHVSFLIHSNISSRSSGKLKTMSDCEEYNRSVVHLSMRSAHNIMGTRGALE